MFNYRILFRSFTSLTSLQLINYLAPLITFPYLLQTLGPKNYGLVIFSTAIASYFANFIDLGFNYSANQKIAITNDLSYISKLFSTVQFVKLISSVLSLIILSLILFFLNISYLLLIVIIYSVFIAINNSLYPTWFLLGKELTHYSTFIVAPIRIISIILIFSIVIDDNSVIELMQINLFSSFMTMTISTIFIIRHYRIKIILPRLKEIQSELFDSFKIYKGIGAITLYTASNNLLLGIITNNTMVGIFNAADKIRLAFQSGVTIIGQSLFPQVSRNIKIEKEKTINELLLFMYIGASLVLLLTIIAYLFSENIIHLIAGKNYYPAIKVFKIICFIPFIVFVSNILGIQIMLNLEMTKIFNKIIWCGGILNISLLLILIPLLSVFGAAYSVLFTESFISLIMLFIIYKRRIVTDV